MRNVSKSIVGLIGLCIALSCAKENKETQNDLENKKNPVISKKAKTDDLNISFLLDLSDRIDPEKYPNRNYGIFYA